MKDHVYSGAVGSVLCIVLFVLKSCGIGVQYEDLGGGYMLEHEGNRCSYITGEIPPNGVVPPNVISYDYDDRFIVAKQCPMGDEVYGEDAEQYVGGLDSVYYWLVLKDEDRLFGPMLYGDYVRLRDVYSVSKTLLL